MTVRYCRLGIDLESSYFTLNHLLSLLFHMYGALSGKPDDTKRPSVTRIHGLCGLLKLRQVTATQ